jgi:heme-degrading monooxygenase HmoA
MNWMRVAVYRLGDEDGRIAREEAVRLTREEAAPLLHGLPGFLDYELVEAGDTFLAISHWRTQAEAAATAAVHEEWRQAHAPTLPRPVAVYVGEVVIPRDGTG